MRRLVVRSCVLVLVLAAVACGSREPLRVTAIQLGRSVNADSTVTDQTTRFGPHDTVHLAVITAGAAKGTLSVRWTFGGKIVAEPSKPAPSGDGVATEFSLQTATGFPPGEYSAEVFLDGHSMGTRTFRIEAPR